MRGEGKDVFDSEIDFGRGDIFSNDLERARLDSAEAILARNSRFEEFRRRTARISIHSGMYSLCVVIIDKHETRAAISWAAQMARYLSQKRARPASWPAPFCVSARLRGVSTLQLRPRLALSPPAAAMVLLTELSLFRLTGSVLARARARLCSGARVLCEFHSQLHETVCALPRGPVYIF